MRICIIGRNVKSDQKICIKIERGRYEIEGIKNFIVNYLKTINENEKTNIEFDF